jgi:hypothetical protein
VRGREGRGDHAAVGLHRQRRERRRRQRPGRLHGEPPGLLEVGDGGRSTPAQPRASTTDALRIADILENDIPQNGVTVNASASGHTVSVSIPAREMLAQIDERGRADAMIYVFSGTRAVATKVKRIDIEAEKASKAPRDAAIHFEETFDLPPGNYVAKVLVRLGDSMGFAKTDFTVTE